MADMENIVKMQSKALQDLYVTESEGGGEATCGSDQCDHAWSGGSFLPQFLNRGTSSNGANTCTRIDLTPTGDVTSAAIGGRRVATRPDENGSSAEQVRCKYASELCPKDKEDYPIRSAVQEAKGGLMPSGSGSSTTCVDNKESRAEYFTRTGCLSVSDKGKCVVKKSVYGFSVPDSKAEMSKVGKLESCSSQQLLETSPSGFTIKETAEKYPQTAWHFSGFQQTGLYRNWPSIYQCRTEAQCSGCSDPRFRGWYAGAASGPKDVVIIIDTSGSMSNSGRMAAAIEAAQWTVNTLSATDYATVVAFSSTARVFGSTQRLLPMTAANRKALKSYLSTLVPQGSTNMKAAFEEAFDVIARSSSVGTNSAGCNKIFLFLSDGAPTEGQEPEALIKQRNGGRSYLRDDEEAVTSTHVRIFTYAFGDNAPGALMKRIACDNSAIYRKVKDSDKDKLKSIMASYFVYLAAGIKGAAVTATASWTDAYEDGQGMGRMTGACSAAYDKTKDPVQLLAVLCLGLPIDTAKTLTGWSSAYAAAMAKRKTCPVVSYSFLQLEALRATSSPESVCIMEGCDEICDESPTDKGAVGAFVGGVIGAIIVLALCNVGMKKARANREQTARDKAANRERAPAHIVPVAVAAPPVYCGGVPLAVAVGVSQPQAQRTM